MDRAFIVANVSSEGSTRCATSDAMVRAMTPSLAFCYRERLDVERLREALSRVLADFPIYGGRLKEQSGAWRIDHAAGPGVAFEQTARAEPSVALGEAASDTRVRLACPRISWLRAVRGKGPLLAVRFTDTPDGCVLGVTWHHMVGDVHSTMLLLRAWARAYQGLEYEPPLDVPDRDAYLGEHLEESPGERPDAHPQVRVASWSELFRLAWATVAFRRIDLVFEAHQLSALHATASSRRAVSMNDALCAYLFCKVREHLGSDERAGMAITVNYRKRLGLPGNLLGNMLDSSAIEADPSDDTARIAAALREGIEGFIQAPRTHHSVLKFRAANPGWSARTRCVPSALDLRRGNLLITSHCNFGMDDLTFNTERPSYLLTSPQDGPIPWGVVLYSSAGGGVTARMWLPAQLAQRMQREHKQLSVSVLTAGPPSLGNQAADHIRRAE